MILKAKNLMIRVDGMTIALATSCNLNISVSTLDARTKSSYGACDIPLDTAWSVSTSHLVGLNDAPQHTVRSVLNYILDKSLVEVEFCAVVDNSDGIQSIDWQPDDTAVMPWLYGSALVKSVAISAEAVGNAYMTIELIGQGPLNIRA